MTDKKKRAKTTICARAIGADGEPSKFLSEDCLGCPFAGGKHGPAWECGVYSGMSKWRKAAKVDAAQAGIVKW